MAESFPRDHPDPDTFIDHVAAASPDADNLLVVQEKEWDLLFRYCYQGALIP